MAKLNREEQMSVLLSWYDLITHSKDWKLFVGDRAILEFRFPKKKKGELEDLGRFGLFYRELGKKRHPDDFRGLIQITVTKDLTRNLASLAHECAHALTTFFLIWADKNPRKVRHSEIWRIFYAKITCKILKESRIEITENLLRCKNSVNADLEIERLIDHGRF